MYVQKQVSLENREKDIIILDLTSGRGTEPEVQLYRWEL